MGEGSYVLTVKFMTCKWCFSCI